MSRPHVLIILADTTTPEDLHVALGQIDAHVSMLPLQVVLRDDPIPVADAVVMVVPPEPRHLTGPLGLIFDRLAAHPRATLILASDGHTRPYFEHPPTVPVSYAADLDEHDLQLRLVMMLEMRNSLDSLHRTLEANRRTGQSVARRYVNQLRLASQVQRGFLPESLPTFGPVSFDALFRPVDYVSGDIYDVHRLDEEHVAIGLADACGHGIPAALLTVYIKRALRGKQIEHGTYRLLSPDEVLLGLNEDILEAQLAECPFVAAVYAVLNTETLELTFARGGTPYPIRRSADGTLEIIKTAGNIVGVLDNSYFEVGTLQLQPGDSILFYSDGLERVVAPEHTGADVPAELHAAAAALSRSELADASPTPGNAGHASASCGSSRAPAASAVAPSPCQRVNASVTWTGTADPIAIADRCDGFAPCGAPGAQKRGDAAHSAVTTSAWYRLLAGLGSKRALEALASRQHTLRRMGYPLDDLTVVALNVNS